MICRSCGNEIKDGVAFCPKCGKPTGGAPSLDATVVANETDAQDATVLANDFEAERTVMADNSFVPESFGAGEMDQTMAANNNYAQQQPSAQPPKKGKGKAIAIVIAVVVVIAAVVAAVFLLKPADGGEGDEDGTTEKSNKAEITETVDNEKEGKVEEVTKDYYTQLKEDAISSAESLAASGDIVGAIEELQNAEYSVGEDTDLASKKKEYETTYITDIITQADTLIAAESYDEAKALLNEAVNNVSDATELNKKLKYIELLNPVSLFSMHLIDAVDYEVKDAIYVDSFGNAHDGYAHFDNVGYSDQRYAIYNLKKESITLSGSFVACQDTGSAEQMIVQIYVDDVLKYKSPQFGKTSGKIDFKIDVTGGQKLKIKADLASGYWGNACFAIVDTQLVRDADLILSQMDASATSGATKGEGKERLHLVDSKGYKEKGDVLVDSFGNTHDGYAVFDDVGYSDQRYATYTLNQACKKFNGSIVACQDTGSAEQMVVMIYVDDVLKYTSPTFGKTTERIDFSVDVLGAKNITIKTGLASGYWGNAKFALVDLGTEA